MNVFVTRKKIVLNISSFFTYPLLTDHCNISIHVLWSYDLSHFESIPETDWLKFCQHFRRLYTLDICYYFFIINVLFILWPLKFGFSKTGREVIVGCEMSWNITNVYEAGHDQSMTFLPMKYCDNVSFSPIEINLKSFPFGANVNNILLSVDLIQCRQSNTRVNRIMHKEQFKIYT